MKPEHKNKAFDGTLQELKVIVWVLVFNSDNLKDYLVYNRLN
jgi:hypothetical protein